MEKTQFDTLMLAITGLDAKLSTRMDRLDAKMDQGFSDVRKDLEVIAAQTAKTVEDVTTLNKRIQRIPSA